jgi:hypothetical protein
MDRAVSFTGRIPIGSTLGVLHCFLMQLSRQHIETVAHPLAALSGLKG